MSRYSWDELLELWLFVGHVAGDIRLVFVGRAQALWYSVPIVSIAVPCFGFSVLWLGSCNIDFG